MKMKDIINGSLYVNKETNQVERVRSKANTQSVFTTVHGKDLKLVNAGSLKLASTIQVDKYMDESKGTAEMKPKIRLGLPPLPKVNV
tara:strand:+ start:360 stop:620 length:261 start_codon:yes stop_codon:yes gene_type:complete